MTIAEALNEFKGMNPCGADDAVLIKWLSEAEKIVANEIILTHKDAPERAKNFEGYSYNDSRDTELFASGGFERLYTEYLAMKYYVFVCDSERYNSFAQLFFNSYGNFADAYNRSHRPLERVSGFKI